ncbi:MAG: UDP-N-acetylmuramoyl-L-alanyl-D-glutamate--2,6-diaminopimelate ligase [Bdellovibrionales bacterium]|nr:UDP-N-acetylmuramoyl-L-alanyl-D-glutamate--2,6-diaminopimelate ligase [Bdellovibrionales bacterium]
MKLAQLFSVFPQLRWGETAGSDVQEITQDSRQAKPGTVFVAIRGNSSDGHQFLSQAAASGALALVVEDDSRIPVDYKGAVVKVPNTRRALDVLAQRFYGNPAQNLFCVGVTGTNGKTTIAYMVEAIFTQFGWPTGVLGTIDHHLGKHKWESALTTPDALTLQRRLKEFISLGARAAAFEVSSHALDQSRADSLPFAVGIFTNLTRDHLDYHHTMESYFAAKEKLFSDLLGRATTSVAVLNTDDAWVRKTRVKEGVTTWSYGQRAADFTFRVLKQDLNGSLFHLSTPRGNTEVNLPSPGLHNVYNATAAIAAGLAAGVSLETAAMAMSGFYGAPGRLEKVPNSRGLHIFVDYAHTDDALRTVLRALHETRTASRSAGRILTVFGCGGDRDRGKRPLMAQAACEFSDVIVITSDNPRTEDPQAIIAQIEAGVPTGWKGQRLMEIDRRQALSTALQTAREGDVILVAGKGHEDYQILGTQKHPFSDQKILTELLKD